VHELLSNLAPDAWVLDLGAAGGSFASDRALRIDLERESLKPPHGVQADAARLPLRDHSFAVVISNHSMEHFENLGGALAEIGRVIKPEGALYVAVPDASTLCDRIYRWLARGGGHVNAFHSAPELARQIEEATGLRHAATRTLCTSFSYLNRKNRRAAPPKKLYLLGGGTEISLHLFNAVFRLSDRWLNTRLSVYGWALYFGNIDAGIDKTTWRNVCIRCGSGHPRSALAGRLAYRCPTCGAANLISAE
jgi:SAM-dependent methyltransferase